MRLQEIGIQEAQLRPMAEQAATYQRLLRLSPRPLAVDDLEAILRSAY
jgi:alcohol dehydrogenase class IV